MQFSSLPDRMVLNANDPNDELPEEVEVCGARGEHLAGYTLFEVTDACGRGLELSRGDYVEEPPVRIAVTDDRLPERFTLELTSAGPCRRHGWDCPHWQRSAVYVRKQLAKDS